MQVEAELSRVSPPKDTLLTIGVFDGVHLGHKHLLGRLMTLAKQQDLLAVVLTFRQHPQDFFSPRSKLPFLTDLEERTRLLKGEGIDLVVALTFNEELAKLGARQFLELLQKYLKMRGLVVGPDFALGRNREGDVEALRRLGQEMNFSVDVVPPLKINGEIASSTAIRQALAAGDTEKVARLAGRPFGLKGKVVPGAGRGVGLGFPTANLEINQEQAIPADGVYTSWTYIGGKVYPAVTNVGTDPTFGKGKRTVEVHIIDYHGELYGRELRVDFIERLRGEKKFSSVEALKKQMAEDVEQGKALLISRNRR